MHSRLHNSTKGKGELKTMIGKNRRQKRTKHSQILSQQNEERQVHGRRVQPEDRNVVLFLLPPRCFVRLDRTFLNALSRKLNFVLVPQKRRQFMG
jgi:hypothetical protein